METAPAITVAHDTHHRARRRAIALVLAASALFTFSSAIIKWLGPAIPPTEMIAIRSVFALIPLWPLFARQGLLHALRTRHWGLHAQRTIFGFIGMVTSIHGYVVLPLVLVTALGFVMPLFALAYASGAIGTEREGRTLLWDLATGLPNEMQLLGSREGMGDGESRGGGAPASRPAGKPAGGYYGKYDDKAASDFITRWLDVDSRQAALRAKYVPIVGKVLPGIISPMRTVPAHIERPAYADTGVVDGFDHRARVVAHRVFQPNQTRETGRPVAPC